MQLTTDQWNTIGANRSEQAQFTTAIHCFRQALMQEPSRHDIRANLVDNLRRAWRFEEAEQELRTASKDGMFDKLQFIAGCLYFDWGASQKALDYFTPRICVTPYARFCRAQALLHAGQFLEGFAENESRLEMTPWGTPPMPMWKGESLEGKRVAIHHEQGYGDTLAYLRWVNQLPPEQVILGMPGALVDLVKASFPDYEVVSTNEPLKPADYYLPLMSLPHRLSVSEMTPPAPYIRPSGRFDIPRPPGTRIKVGLVWRSKSGQQHNNPSVALHGAQKSIPLEYLLPLGDIPGVSLYNLQTDGQADIVKLGADYLIFDLASKCQGFDDLARFMQEMDIIVSVDTAPLHLAGAMGLKTIGLLSCRGGWPFPGNGEMTPWYSSVTLIRQPTPFDWQSVVSTLKAHIEALL